MKEKEFAITQYIPVNRKFFEKQIPEEDEEFTLSDELQNKYGKLDKIFESFFDYESVSNAKVFTILIIINI